MAGLHEVAKRAGCKASHAVAVFQAITALLAEGTDVRVAHFGSFQSKIQKPRKVTSPVLPGGTGTSPARRVIRFSMAQDLRRGWELEVKE